MNTDTLTTADGVTITRQHAIRIAVQHGLTEAQGREILASLVSEDGLYSATDVLSELGY